MGNYTPVQVFNSPAGIIFGNNVISQAYLAGNPTDPGLEWESTSQYNAGLDLGLFHDRLSIIANYYDSRSYNLLVNKNVSAISGASTILTNLRDSTVMNRGFDIQ